VKKTEKADRKEKMSNVQECLVLKSTEPPRCLMPVWKLKETARAVAPSCSPGAGPASQRQLCLVGTAAAAKRRFRTQTGTEQACVFTLPKLPSMSPLLWMSPVQKLSLQKWSQDLYTSHSPRFSPATSFCLSHHKGPEEEEKLKYHYFFAWFSSLCLAHTLNPQTKNKPMCV